MLQHSGEKPFACNQCSFSCRRQSELKYHMLSHTPPWNQIWQTIFGKKGFDSWLNVNVYVNICQYIEMSNRSVLVPTFNNKRKILFCVKKNKNDNTTFFGSPRWLSQGTEWLIRVHDLTTCICKGQLVNVKESNLVTKLTMLTIPDQLRISNHDIEG